jgi:hypothetical protein
MSTLQVRNVPEHVRRTLKERAAASGQSLSEYLLGELSRLASQPTLDDLTLRIHHRGAQTPPTSAAAVLRSERASRS